MRLYTHTHTHTHTYILENKRKKSRKKSEPEKRIELKNGKLSLVKIKKVEKNGVRIKRDINNVNEEILNKKNSKATTKKSHSKVEQNSGITLIALIIIIVVLLILAGISIAMLTGNNSIIKNAQQAKVETEIAQFRERIKIIVLGSYNEKGNFDGEKLKKDLTNEGIDYTIKDEEIWIEKPYGGYIIISIKTGEIREEPGGGNTGDPSGEPTEDPTLGQYTIRYNANNGTGTMEDTVLGLNEEKALSENKFEREGYIFGGWSTVAGGEKEYNPIQVVKSLTSNKNEIVNLYAVWIPITYAVTYELNGGTLNIENPTYTEYDAEIVIDNPTKEGYAFAGWTITGMTNTTHQIGEAITSVETISGIKDTSFKNLRNDVGTVTFTAIWTASTDIKYKVEHYLMDTKGEYPEEATATQELGGKAEETITLESLQQPYTGFKYSYGQVDKTTVETTSILADGSRTIKLYYTRNRPTLNFNGNGVTNPTPITEYYEVPITTKLERIGYTFVGWFTDPTIGDKVETMPADSGTVYAHWAPNTYTLTLDPNGGIVNPTSVTLKYGEPINVTATKQGYTFDGWFTDLTAGDKVETMPTGGKVYAHWTIQQYTITLNVDGGSGVPSSQTYNYGETLPTPTKTYNTFAGWWDSPTGGTQYTKVPAENKQLYAHWNPINYTLTFNANGGECSTTTITKHYGEAITLPTPTRANYKFDGWFDSQTGGNKITWTTMQAKNITVWAHWTFAGLSGQALTQYETVQIGSEKFYVLENSSANENEAKLLSWYNLNQEATAQLNATAEDTACAFAKQKYWTGQTNTHVDLNYSHTDSIAFARASSYGSRLGGTGRLPLRSEVVTTGDASRIWFGLDIGAVDKGLYYWLGCTYSPAAATAKSVCLCAGAIRTLPSGSQSARGCSYTTNVTEVVRYGVRPIVTIDKSKITSRVE